MAITLISARSTHGLEKCKIKLPQTEVLRVRTAFPLWCLMSLKWPGRHVRAVGGCARSHAEGGLSQRGLEQAPRRQLMITPIAQISHQHYYQEKSDSSIF